MLATFRLSAIWNEEMYVIYRQIGFLDILKSNNTLIEWASR